uniref:Uncharacterized protein n=1 Tax=Panagrellus redivivus TaxID=6233 RepID=A0A7E4ZPU8_PANRE
MIALNVLESRSLGEILPCWMCTYPINRAVVRAESEINLRKGISIPFILDLRQSRPGYQSSPPPAPRPIVNTVTKAGRTSRKDTSR